MRQAIGMGLFIAASLVSTGTQAQVRVVVPTQPQTTQPNQVQGQGRREARLMDRLRDEMWAYRQELNFFQRAPEYQQLVDLRYTLRELAMRVAQAPEGDPQVQRTAREMEQAGRQLYLLTGQLEARSDLGAPQEVRRRADALRDRAVEIRVLIGRLHEAVRLDFDGSGAGA